MMDMCKMGQLSNIDEGQVRSEAYALEVAHQLFRAIQHCHEMGIVHRDIKPEVSDCGVYCCVFPFLPLFSPLLLVSPARV